MFLACAVKIAYVPLSAALVKHMDESSWWGLLLLAQQSPLMKFPPACSGYAQAKPETQQRKAWSMSC
jgi:hypothetical protein